MVVDKVEAEAADNRRTDQRANSAGASTTSPFFLSASVPEDMSTSIINIWSVRG
jgi:hypothetical protein